MANEAEIIKLAGILIGGGVVAGIGQMIINKSRKAKKSSSSDDYDYSAVDSSSSGSGGNEDKARDYIMQYKGQYPRESLKQGLLNMGISDSEAEGYLNKYM